MNRKTVFVSILGAAALMNVQPVHAASIWVGRAGQAYAFFLEGEQDNAHFDTLSVSLTATGGAAFGNVDSGFDGARPRRPGEQYTFINPRLELPIAFGGKGFTLVGDAVNSTSVSYDGTLLGGVIDTSGEHNGRLHLATLMFPAAVRFDAQVELISGGQVVSQLSYVPPLTGDIPDLPEPAALTQLSIGAALMVAARRRAA